MNCEVHLLRAVQSRSGYEYCLHFELMRKSYRIMRMLDELQVSGNVTYNGHGMREIVGQRSAAYISQHDVHLGELTVRETLAFSARCQGVGTNLGLCIFSISLTFQLFFSIYIYIELSRRQTVLIVATMVFLYVIDDYAEMLAELSRREKVANIRPDPDVDIYMKVRFNLLIVSFSFSPLF